MRKVDVSSPSRPAVRVVFRMSTSTSPDWRAVNRCSVVSGRNSTASGSPRTAAATARQKSMSNPEKLPSASTKPNPGTASLTPQISVPRSCTAARVSPAGAAAVVVSVPPAAVVSVPPAAVVSVPPAAVVSVAPPVVSVAAVVHAAITTARQARSIVFRFILALSLVVLGTANITGAAGGCRRRSINQRGSAGVAISLA